MPCSCSSCPFYRQMATVDAGTCHRYAPKPLQVMVGAIKDWPENITEWPTVNHDDFCGEHPAFNR